MNNNIVYLGLGSNLNQPIKQIDNAIHLIQHHSKITCLNLSPYYQSKPHGQVVQSDFINTALKISTSLAPFELLSLTQSIEQQAKRIKTQHWGPRTLDIDIILYSKLILDSETLVIPHPLAIQREFVIKPLWDIDNTIQFPNHQCIDDLIKTLPIHQLIKIKNGTTFNH